MSAKSFTFFIWGAALATFICLSIYEHDMFIAPAVPLGAGYIAICVLTIVVNWNNDKK